ncbi:MAG: hypothetical protein AB7O57_02890 [Hyphomicrobiaceae bacterium]
MQSIYHFESTGAAYDACNMAGGPKRGDILVIQSERVIGLADTWPVSVTAEAGQLHTLRVPASNYHDDIFTRDQIADAVELAARFGWILHVAFRDGDAS